MDEAGNARIPRILIAFEEHFAIRQLSPIFLKVGYEVVTATDGCEALEKGHSSEVL